MKNKLPGWNQHGLNILPSSITQNQSTIEWTEVTTTI